MKAIYMNGENLLFENNGNGTFTNVAESQGVDDPGRSRTGVVGDYDDDGDYDLYVINYGDSCKLYRNDQNTNNNYLKIEDVKKEKNRVVKSQKYEEAAQLRDKEKKLIAQLEEEKTKWEDMLLQLY